MILLDTINIYLIKSKGFYTENRRKMTFKTITTYPRKLKLINKRFCIVLAIILLFLIFYLVVLQLSFFCLPIVIKHKISKLCDQYERHEISGNLCEDLCTRNSVKEFICPINKYRNNALFIGVKDHDVLVFKAANPLQHETEILVWKDNLGYKHYPSEDEFLGMMRRLILFKFNKTLENEAMKLLFYPKNVEKITNEYMTEIWQLIQDNEFMLTTLIANNNLFPRIFGTCGTIYAVEKIDKLAIASSLDLFRHNSIIDFKNRVNLALEIIDYLYELDDIKPESLSLCDVSLSSFGRVNNRIKLVNLKHVHPVSIVDRKLSDGKFCTRDIDCCYKNCLSKCDNFRCVQKQLNNNFQIVCNKVLKGTTYRPGLLVTSKTPGKLLALLDKCAAPIYASDSDPNRPFGASSEISDAIYSLLTHIYADIPVS